MGEGRNRPPSMQEERVAKKEVDEEGEKKREGRFDGFPFNEKEKRRGEVVVSVYRVGERGKRASEKTCGRKGEGGIVLLLKGREEERKEKSFSRMKGSAEEGTKRKEGRRKGSILHSAQGGREGRKERAYGMMPLQGGGKRFQGKKGKEGGKSALLILGKKRKKKKKERMYL